MSPHPRLHPPPRFRKRPEGGFALLLTVTLLAFLVLILVALAAFARVETQVVANSQQLAQARQNALMGLNIALGQLQKYAGPDQRVTATADIAGGASGVRLANGAAPDAALTSSIAPPAIAAAGHGAVSKGLPTSLQAGTRHWTGVWRNTDIPSDIYKQTPSPVLLNWLVSGNENATFSQAGGASGYQAGTNISYSPSSAVSGNPAAVSATDTTTLKLGGQPAVILVGSKTADSNSHTLMDGTNEAAADRYVVAPLVPITAPAGSVPGQDPTDAPPIGRYAYWVGDEGVKAKLNVSDPNYTDTDPGTQPKARYRLMTSPRAATEIVTGLASYPDPTATTYGNVSKVLDRSQAGLLSNAASFTTALGQNYHSLTAHGYGVQADSLNGGLRRDLTRALEPATWNADPNDTLQGLRIIPAAYTPTQGPYWDWLHDHYKLADEFATNGAINLRMTTNSGAAPYRQGVAPVLLRSRLLFRLRIAGGQMYLQLTPAIVLANPYNVPLRSTGALSFGFKLNPVSVNDINLVVQAQGNISYPPGTDSNQFPATQNRRYLVLPRGTGANPPWPSTPNGYLGDLRFQIPAGTLDIPPGGTQVFTLAANTSVAIPSSAPIPLASTLPIPPFNYYEQLLGSVTTPSSTSGLTGYRARISERDGNAPATGGGLNNLDITLYDSAGSVVQAWLGSDMRGSPNFPTSSASLISATGGVGDVCIYEQSLWQPGEFVNVTKTDSVPGAPEDFISYDYPVFRDYNIRGSYLMTPRVSFCYGQWSGSAFAELPPYRAAYTFAGDFNTAFTAQLAAPTWGWAINSGSTTQTVLFDVPRRWETNSPPLTSIGQLQHASLTADNNYPGIGHQPAYAVGNSFYAPFVSRDRAVHANRPFQFSFNGGSRVLSSSDIRDTYFDISYLLNAALWDGNYFSTVWPNTAQLANGTVLTPSNPLPNPRLKPVFGAAGTATGSNLRSSNHAASNYLGIDGAFNVNSTSVEAWAALLAGTRKLAYPNDTSTALEAVFARTQNQPSGATYVAGSVVAPAGDDVNTYAGIRRLTDAQVQSLAVEIVKQVRMRGPFVSLAHFINRSLTPATNTASAIQDLGMQGPLQAAIGTTAPAINDFTSITNAPAIAPAVDGADWILHYGSPDDSSSTSPNTTQLFPDFLQDVAVKNGRRGRRSDGAPGFLTQADILQVLGPVLSARSDTFIIRTYGDTLNPATGETTAQAWCEAVIQRTPDYVDQSDTNLTSRGNATAPASTNIINQTFGRRFVVVSFRWLTPNDI